MPYSPEHKARTRARIVAAARRLFNHRGFGQVSIDEIMGEAGLTRGGFYNHFQRKEDLYAEAVTHVLSCEPGTGGRPASVRARQLVAEYLSDRRLSDLDGSCPLIAYPTDVARGGDGVKQAYRHVLCGLIKLLQGSLGNDTESRSRAITMATLCVGGMMLARAVDDAQLGKEIRNAAMAQALAIIEPQAQSPA
jgi:AcrR family transcriptional regulator